MKRGSTFKKIVLASLFALEALFLNGCLGPVLQKSTTIYYTLDYESPGHPGIQPTQANLQVNPFSISPIYNSGRMIYSDGNFVRNNYEYHQWRTNPVAMVPFFLTMDLRKSNLFQGVFASGVQIKATHTMEGIVSQFYEKDNKENWQAILGLEITLLKNDADKINKTVLFQRSYAAIKPCAKKTPASFVEAMSSAMQEISQQITLDTYNQIKAE